MALVVWRLSPHRSDLPSDLSQYELGKLHKMTLLLCAPENDLTVVVDCSSRALESSPQTNQPTNQATNQSVRQSDDRPAVRQLASLLAMSPAIKATVPSR